MARHVGQGPCESVLIRIEGRRGAESEACQSKQAMSSLATRTDAAVAAHEAREQMERKAREEAENKCHQLTLDLEWQKHSHEQVCPCIVYQSYA